MVPELANYALTNRDQAIHDILGLDDDALNKLSLTGLTGHHHPQTSQVGSFPSNRWGLHDMHGNVFEWCRDWYLRFPPRGEDVDLHSAQRSATRSEHGDISRVRRGGCWADDGWACRSAFRLRFEPERRADHIGMRVVAVQSRN